MSKELSDMERAYVARIKSLEVELLATFTEIQYHLAGAVDQRWVSIAKTQIELGFLALNKGMHETRTLPSVSFLEK